LAQINWTLQALDDIGAICLFIARDAPSIAEVYAQKLFDAVDRLEMFPLSGRVVPEFEIEDIREVIFGNYRIIYQIQDEVVNILTVHHAARLLKFKFSG